jgi:hypothetical protein
LRSTSKKILERLEAQVEAETSEWEIPLDVRLLLKEQARFASRASGQTPPPYSAVELNELYQQDLDFVTGRGDLAELGRSSGWQTEEGQALLGVWEEDAHRRLARAEELGDEWRLAYEFDENDEVEEDELWTQD